MTRRMLNGEGVFKTSIYNDTASIIIARAIIKMPIPIALNPAAKIPVTNLLINLAIIIPAAIAANADINEVPSIKSGKILL